MAVRQGFGFVFMMRVLQGFSVATSFPAMGSIISEWSTTRRSGAYIGKLFLNYGHGKGLFGILNALYTNL